MSRVDQPPAAESVTTGPLCAFKSWYAAHYAAEWNPAIYFPDYMLYLCRIGVVTIPAAFSMSGVYETYRLR